MVFIGFPCEVRCSEFVILARHLAENSNASGCLCWVCCSTRPVRSEHDNRGTISACFCMLPLCAAGAAFNFVSSDSSRDFVILPQVFISIMRRRKGKPTTRGFESYRLSMIYAYIRIYFFFFPADRVYPDTAFCCI